MPTSPFEATNSWCYHFARYQAIPEILAMPESADSQPFRLVELVKKVMNIHLTPEQQATKYARRDTGLSISIAASIKFYVPFVAKNTEQLVPLGGGMYRVPSVEDVDSAASKAEEAEIGLAGVDGDEAEIEDFDGWVYAFTFPPLMKSGERFPIKVGMTATDVDARVTSQCRSSAAFDRPVVLNKWRVKRVGAVESAIHQVLKARGQWREHALGSEWFDSRPEEIDEILKFVTKV
jgi:T5orf172 domain